MADLCSITHREIVSVPITTAVCPEIHNEEVARQVKAEQTNLLYRFGWGTDAPSLIVATILALESWGGEGANLLTFSTLYLACIALARGGLGYAFRRRSIPIEAARPWERAYFAATVLLALGWGLGGCLLLKPDSWLNEALPALLIAAVAALALPLLNASFMHYLGFLVLAFVPLMLRLLLRHDATSLSVFLALGVCGVFFALIAKMANARLLEGLNLRFSYASIVEELTGQVSERTRVETKLREGEERMRRQSQSLLELAREASISAGDLKGALTVITEKASQAIHCKRIAVWFLDEKGASLRCAHVLHGAQHSNGGGETIDRRRSPALFDAIHETRTYAVSDTIGDTRVGELKEYLRPHGVTALLVAPFRHGQKLRGVITHEYQGGVREWTRDEASFASSLADFVSLALTANERREAEDKLREMANYDRLTGLPNRSLFMDRMAQALAKGRRSHQQVALLFVDMDRFK